MHPEALKDAALFCLNRHHFYNRPDKANLQKAAKVLGKFQLAFFHLWGITYENSKMVSFQNMKDKQVICVKYTSLHLFIFDISNKHK